MTKEDLYRFIKDRKLAVVSTVTSKGRSESALIGIAVTPALEVIFDTSRESRKVENLRNNPHVSLVIGWDDETTLQYQGVADEPTGQSLERCKEIYFAAFPDGRERAKSSAITHFLVKPSWARYCCFKDPLTIREFAISEHSFEVIASHA